MIEEKFYISLCAIFSVLIVTGNLVYQKFVYLPIFPFHTFELSVGAIFYPLTFLITDLIAEFYGKKKAEFCVRLATFLSIMVAIMIMVMDKLEATIWSKINNEIFNQVFGFFGISLIGSLIAVYTAQLVDISLYLWLRKITQHKYLWVMNISTAIALFIDTFIVVSILAIFGGIPIEHVWWIILNSYLFKVFFTLCSTPIFYVSVYLIKATIKTNQVPISLP